MMMNTNRTVSDQGLRAMAAWVAEYAASPDEASRMDRDADYNLRVGLDYETYAREVKP